MSSLLYTANYFVFNAIAAYHYADRENSEALSIIVTICVILLPILMFCIWLYFLPSILT